MFREIKVSSPNKQYYHHGSRIKNEIQERTSIDHTLYFKKQNIIQRNISNTYTGMKECIENEIIKLISSILILSYKSLGIV